MNELILNVVNKYLEVFPEESDRQQYLIKYLKNHTSTQIADWNNFDGHIVATRFYICII